MYLLEDRDVDRYTVYTAINDHDEMLPYTLMICRDIKEIKIWGFIDHSYFEVKSREKQINEVFQLFKDFIINDLYTEGYCVSKGTYGGVFYKDWENGNIYRKWERE